MQPAIKCIVEGDGEVGALPMLVRRIANGMHPPLNIEIRQSIKLPRTKLLKKGELERAIAIAKYEVGLCGIIILMDADKACPAELGPRLKEHALRVAGGVPVTFTFAKWEYEAWFIASCASLAARGKLTPDVSPPGDLEGVRDAKGWISARMLSDRPYKETLDQEKFSSLFSIDEALQNSRSFRKFHKEVVEMLSGFTR
jgi:hypothetical protein